MKKFEIKIKDQIQVVAKPQTNSLKIILNPLLLRFYFWMIRLLAIVTFILLSQTANGQYLEDEIFQFLKLPANARTTAFGGQQVAFYDADVQLVANNAAQLTDTLHQHFIFSNMFVPAGIQSGNLAYTHHFKKGFNGMASLQFVNYGNFTETDVNANELGEFSAVDLALNIGGSWQKGHWVFGATTKLIYSAIDNYGANAVALDAGLIWQKKRTSFGATIKNFGAITNSFSELETDEKLPLDIQLGFSQRLQHVPFRFSVNMHNLHRWNIRYDDPTQQQNSNIFGEEQQQKSTWADEMFRHFIFSGEFYLGKPLSIQFAYNHKRAQEMRFAQRKGLAGFSFGLGINTKKFDFNYGIGVLSSAGSYHHLTISTHLSAWKNKKKKKIDS